MLDDIIKFMNERYQNEKLCGIFRKIKRKNDS